VVLVSGRRFLPRFGAGAGGVFLLANLSGCSGNKHAPPVPEEPIVIGAGGGTPADACSPTTPPDPTALGLCGSVLLSALGDPSNFYFLIDRSGSMSDVVDGRMKYDSLATAAVALVRDLGARINVGGAVFPGWPQTPDDSCRAGGEAFATQRGDWPSTARCGNDGPTTKAFSRAISLPSGIPPFGGTPTAATLAKIAPTLTSLADGRRTYLVIATDGGPNCNFDATCDISTCIGNIEQSPACDPNVNCCAVGAPGGPAGCLDSDATVAQIAALREQGVSTYVIGIPGSAPYASLLNAMATAGGTARAADPLYYDVPNISELGQVLASIATEVVLTCNFVLEQPPEVPDRVNVYFDREQVLYDEQNGWTWRAATQTTDAGSDDGGSETDAGAAQAPLLDYTRFDLHGVACDRLMSGQVTDVLVAFGCPTVLIK
jgi:hypothetical protein